VDELSHCIKTRTESGFSAQFGESGHGGIALHVGLIDKYSWIVYSMLPIHLRKRMVYERKIAPVVVLPHPTYYTNKTIDTLEDVRRQVREK
jgi:hypothetical protein